MISRPRVAVLVFGINARRVGGIEMHTRELAGRLGAIGWKVVLCFHKGPSPEVRQYLSLPNVRWEQLPNCWENSWQTGYQQHPMNERLPMLWAGWLVRSRLPASF